MRAPAQFPDEQTDTGEFKRQEDAFRAWITNDGSSPYPVVGGRYHLYISLACPWASRTFIVLKLKHLDNADRAPRPDPRPAAPTPPGSFGIGMIVLG